MARKLRNRLTILSIAGVLEGKMTSNLVGGKIRQFTTTFIRTTYSSSDVSNDISSRPELKGYPPRLPTRSTTQSFSHISICSDTNALKFYGWKEERISNNFYPEHFAKF